MIFAFEDSEVADIRLEGDELLMRFSAGRLHEADRAGAGEGLWQPLLLRCKRLVLPDQAMESDGACILGTAGSVRNVRLYLDGQPLRNLPMPFDSDADFALELELVGDLFYVLRGRGVVLRALPGQCAVGAYQC